MKLKRLQRTITKQKRTSQRRQLEGQELVFFLTNADFRLDRMRTGNRLYSVLNDQQQVNEKPLETIQDLDKEKIKLYNKRQRYLHPNEDLNEGCRFTKEEYEHELMKMKEEREKQLWMLQQKSPKRIYLSELDPPDQQPKRSHTSRQQLNKNKTKVLKAFIQRDLNTKLIEDQINQELNQIEDNENLKKLDKLDQVEKQIKASDMKGLREQVFVNPRQNKLRKNIDQLMSELRKIKAIDPDLQVFKQVYGRRQRGQSQVGQEGDNDNGGQSQRMERELNEIDILMEILSAADGKNDQMVKDQIDQAQNPLSDRQSGSKPLTLQEMPRLHTQEHNQRTYTSNTQPSLKRSAYSQPVLLGFGKNKFNEDQLSDVKSKLDQPMKVQRLAKIDTVLRKNRSQFSQLDLQNGVQHIGNKDYQGRVRNIFIEQKRKLETQVKEVDDKVLGSELQPSKKFNFDYYTIKDIMSDEWVKRLADTKINKNLKQNEVAQFQNEKLRTQQMVKINNYQVGQSSKPKEPSFLQKVNDQKMSIVDLATNKDTKPALKPIKLLNIDNLKKDISTFTKEISDFNRTICKHNQYTNTSHAQTSLPTQEPLASQYSTFETQSFIKQSISNPQQEAFEKRLSNMKPLQKIRKIPPWENLQFKKFSNNKLNEYFTFLQKTFVADLLDLAEQITKERKKLMKNLFMEELDLHYEHTYKPEIRDVTLAIFYAFNTHCDGNMVSQLQMKFCDSMPYVDLNVYRLNDYLRGCYKEFSMFVGSLCDREKDLELLDEQYPRIYEDTLKILSMFYPDITIDPYSPNVSSISTVNYNIGQLRKCRDCIKYCFTQINRDLKGIKDAIMEVKRNPKTMKRIAMVCKVDNLYQPWECYTKIARLRNLNIVPHKEVEYERLNKELQKEKLIRQKQKYEKFIKQQEENDMRESRDKEETDLLFDKLGNRFRKLPSLASTNRGKEVKREFLNSKKISISDVSSEKYSMKVPDSSMKLIKYDFPENAITEEKEESSRQVSPKKPNLHDFEDVGIFKPESSKSSPKKSKVKKLKRKSKKTSDLDIFLDAKINSIKNPYIPHSPTIEKPIDYAPNSFKDGLPLPKSSGVNHLKLNLSPTNTPPMQIISPLSMPKRRRNSIDRLSMSQSDFSKSFVEGKLKKGVNIKAPNQDFVSFHQKKVKVVDRHGKELVEFQKINSDMTVDQFKEVLLEDCVAIKKMKININRVRLTIGDARGPALADKRKTIHEYCPDQSVTLVFKDLGPQISWKAVFLIEYFGPILISVGLAAFQKQIYGKSNLQFNQKLGLAMVVGHYIKRELETLFVHRFSNDTMPFFNLFKNCAHYWFIFGFINMYFFLHPDYTPPAWANQSTFYLIAGAFALFEFMNLMCHITLKNLRKPGTSDRGIPKGWGFDLVSCANYFWEALCWLMFAIQAQSVGAYIFLAVSVFQMLDWAIKKHKRYRKEFKDYPRGRKAMFPFII